MRRQFKILSLVIFALLVSSCSTHSIAPQKETDAWTAALEKSKNAAIRAEFRQAHIERAADRM